MRFFLLKNPQHEGAVAFAAQIANRLLKQGHSLADEASDAYSADAVILCGGDGTVLSNLPLLTAIGKPILAINFGKVGYLSSCEPKDAEMFIKEISNGSFRTEQRMLITGTLKEGETQFPLSALNEITIHRGCSPKAIRLSVCCGDISIGNYTGDGLILATPTGSTAYNLSAGGPVLLPESRMIALTPLCPAKQPAPALVIPADNAVRIDGEFATSALLTMDGCRSIPLTGRCTVQIGEGASVSLIVGSREPICRLLQKRLLPNPYEQENPQT